MASIPFLFCRRRRVTQEKDSQIHKTYSQIVKSVFRKDDCRITHGLRIRKNCARLQDAFEKEKATALVKPWQSSNSECRTLSTLVYTYGAFALVCVKYSASLNTIFQIVCEAWSPPRLHSRVLPLRAA